MPELYKYKEEETLYTYFNKIKKVSIDEIEEGQLVFIRLNSRLNYGVRDWCFYGKITRITDKCFYLLEYFGNAPINDWKTGTIKKMEANAEKYTRRWMKKSIIELYTVSTEEKMKKVELYTNDKSLVK